MDQVEIDVVDAESIEGAAKSVASVLFAGGLNPQLGGEEHVLAGNSRVRDCPPDRLLVLVSGRRIDVPIPNLESLAHRTLGVRRRDLVDAESDDRHLDTVVERDVQG